MKVQNKIKLNMKIVSAVLEARTFIILLLLCILSMLVSSYFLTGTNITNIFRQVASGCILAFGFTAVLSIGGVDLSIDYMVGMLSVVAATLDAKTNIPFIFVIILTILLGILCGGLNSLVGHRMKIPLFIATLATGQIYRGVCNMVCNNSAVGFLSDNFKWIGQGYVGPIPFPTVLLIIIGIFTFVLLNKTVFGRRALAAGGNAECAKLSGINVIKTSAYVYMIMGICAAITALILTGRSASGQPNAAQGMQMDAIAAVVIGGTSMRGGKAKVVGTFFGVLIVGVISNVLNLAGLDSNWQYVAKGIMLVTALGIDIISQKVFDKQLEGKLK